LSTLHFFKFPENSLKVLKLLKNSVEVLKILENKLESMKILENKLESMKILENKLESLKLQENQPNYISGSTTTRKSFIWHHLHHNAIPTLDIYQCGHPSTPAKVVQYQQGFPQGSALGYKPRDWDVPYDVESIRQRRPENISLADWDAQVAF
ncbi:mammalian uncoordinated homology 13 protein, partial [Tanacetum coccineum]